MTSIADVPPTPFSAGSVLSESFSIFFRKFFLLVLLAVVGYVLGLMLQWVLVRVLFAGGIETQYGLLWRSVVLSWSVGALQGGVVSGSVIYAVVMGMRGEPAPFGRSFAIGFSALPRIIVLSLLLAVIYVVGFLLLIVPGVIFVCMYWVATPVTVAERLGPMASLGRSRELTQGYRWSIFGLLLLIFLLLIGIGFLIGWFFPEAALPVTEQSLQVALITGAVNCIFLAFWATITAVSYYKLRVSKEGIDVGQMATMFD